MRTLTSCWAIAPAQAVIFGATGGVMEAALRTAYELITGKELEQVDFTAVRGLEGVKEATIKVGDLDVKVAVAHGTGQGGQAAGQQSRAARSSYHFIEIMGCPGGCVTGGGQPIVPAPEAQLDRRDPRAIRAAALYTRGRRPRPCARAIRTPKFRQLYEEFLGRPNSHKAHHAAAHYVYGAAQVQPLKTAERHLSQCLRQVPFCMSMRQFCGHWKARIRS